MKVETSSFLLVRSKKEAAAATTEAELPAASLRDEIYGVDGTNIKNCANPEQDVVIAAINVQATFFYPTAAATSQLAVPSEEELAQPQGANSNRSEHNPKPDVVWFHITQGGAGESGTVLAPFFGALAVAIPMPYPPFVARSLLIDDIGDLSAGGNAVPVRRAPVDTLEGMEPDSGKGEVGARAQFAQSLSERLTKKFCKPSTSDGSSSQRQTMAFYCCCGITGKLEELLLGPSGVTGMGSAASVPFGGMVFRTAVKMVEKELS